MLRFFQFIFCNGQSIGRNSAGLFNILFSIPLGDNGLYKHVYLAVANMRETWDDMLAKIQKSNSMGHEVYDDMYEKMLDLFPNKILEDYEVNPSTGELSKRSTRVNVSPPHATDAECGGAVLDTGEVIDFNVNTFVLTWTGP